jgi:hypothetical protein
MGSGPGAHDKGLKNPMYESSALLASGESALANMRSAFDE